MFARIVQPPGQRLVQRVDDQGRFAAARHAGHAGEGAERDIDRDILQIVAGGAGQPQDMALLALAALGWHRHLAHTGKVLAGDAGGVLHHLFRRAAGDDLTAMRTGARAHIDQIIGGADRILVMLNHDHRVADVAQPAQRGQQPVIIALMQADGRLVQHIEHAGQAGPDL